MPLSGPCGASRGRRLGPADGADRRGLGAEGVPGSAARPLRDARPSSSTKTCSTSSRPEPTPTERARTSQSSCANWCHIPVTRGRRARPTGCPHFEVSISVRPIDGTVHLGTSPSPPELIGRAQECRALDELVDAVRTGQSRVLVVRGDAGIGKSALLQHLVDAAAGCKVVRATGVESEMELPFAALHQLCAPLLDRPGRAAGSAARRGEYGVRTDERRNARPAA